MQSTHYAFSYVFCVALETLRENHIVHRDLKLENILVDERHPGKKTLKLLDFGLAEVLNDQDFPVEPLPSRRGTDEYASPEVILYVASFPSLI